MDGTCDEVVEVTTNQYKMIVDRWEACPGLRGRKLDRDFDNYQKHEEWKKLRDDLNRETPLSHKRCISKWKEIMEKWIKRVEYEGNRNGVDNLRKEEDKRLYILNQRYKAERSVAPNTPINEGDDSIGSTEEEQDQSIASGTSTREPENMPPTFETPQRVRDDNTLIDNALLEISVALVKHVKDKEKSPSSLHE